MKTSKLGAKVVQAGLGAITGEFKAKIQSRKFLAYVVANVMLLVTMFTVRPDSEVVIGFLKLINIGYFGTQGGIDAIKAGAKLFEKRRGVDSEGPND